MRKKREKLKWSRLELVIVYGLDTYGLDMVAPVVHAIEERWFSYIVYPLH
jgi:hypothetical protein